MKYMHLIKTQDIQNWENYNDDDDWNNNVNNYIYYLTRSLSNFAIITIKSYYEDTGTNYYYKPTIK